MIGEVIRCREECDLWGWAVTRRNGLDIIDQLGGQFTVGTEDQGLGIRKNQWEPLQGVGNTPPFQSLDVDGCRVRDPFFDPI